METSKKEILQSAACRNFRIALKSKRKAEAAALVSGKESDAVQMHLRNADRRMTLARGLAKESRMILD